MNKEPKIRILVGYHKPSFLLEGKTFIPIWGGKACADEVSKENTSLSEYDREWMEEHCLGDDTGENISSKNRTYNEATVLYWMWKNMDKLENPDYVGFLQYRRHWIFDPKFIKRHKIGFSNLILKKVFSPDHQKILNLSDESIQQQMHDCDGIFCVNEHKETFYNFKENHSQDIKYWDTALDIIQKKWPKYANAAKKYNEGHAFVWSNCFIMKREDFLEYAPFLFDVLSQIDQMAAPTYKDLTPEQMRVPGYVSEAMLGIFWTYLREKGKKFKSYPLLYIKNPFDLPDIAPKHIKPLHKKAIPVVFIADENYLKYTSVALLSLIKNAAPDNLYDIIILEASTISQTLKERFLAMSVPNVSIRFFNCRYYMEYYPFADFFHGHLGASPYLKLFIHEILQAYDKAVFLDADVMLLQDIAKLYQQNLNDCVIGGVKDALMTAYKDAPWEERRRYVLDNNKMSDVSGYINSGVLLLNLDKMRKTPYLMESFIREACFQHPKRIHHDQDVINFVLQKKIMYLPATYNFQLRCILEPNIMASSFHKYIGKCYQNICVLHFDGGVFKPWKALTEQHKFIDLWWQYARQTPFYEEIFYNHLKAIEKFLKTECNAMQYAKLCFNYYRCTLLSNLTWGGVKKHYKEKKKKLKENTQKIKKIRKGSLK